MNSENPDCIVCYKVDVDRSSDPASCILVCPLLLPSSLSLLFCEASELPGVCAFLNGLTFLLLKMLVDVKHQACIIWFLAAHVVGSLIISTLH